MKKKPFQSPLKTKYNNARSNLLAIVVFSLLNLVMIAVMERYFLFSSYFSLIFTTSGVLSYQETGEVLYLIVGGAYGVLSVLPYLLCWIFSKKRVGWMIAGLVLFSIDTLLVLSDLPALGLGIAIDLIIHVLLLVYIAFGVKYGLQLKKEREENPDATSTNLESPSNVAPEPLSGLTRELTITRKKAYTGCAISVVYYVNKQPIGELRNGKTGSFQVPVEEFELTAAFSAGISATCKVPAGTWPLAYESSIKMGVWKNEMILTETQPQTPTI